MGPPSKVRFFFFSMKYWLNLRHCTFFRFWSFALSSWLLDTFSDWPQVIRFRKTTTNFCFKSQNFSKKKLLKRRKWTTEFSTKMMSPTFSTICWSRLRLTTNVIKSKFYVKSFLMGLSWCLSFHLNDLNI